MKNAFEIEEGIRFNQFLKLAQKFIDPKIAAPTLDRHLTYLVKKKIVKRTRRGPQNVVYSLSHDSPLISKEDLPLPRKWYDSHQNFRSWSLERITANIMELSALLELETLRLWFQEQLPGENVEELALRSEFIRAFYKQYGDILLDAAKERTQLEYKEAMVSLEKRIADLKKELFEIKKH